MEVPSTGNFVDILLNALYTPKNAAVCDNTRVREIPNLNSGIAAAAKKFAKRWRIDGNLTWADVGFRENYFADLALSGRFSCIAKNYTPEELRTATPELTNVGSYEKCWRQKSGHWIMVKSGTPEEHFSEIFTAAIGKHLGFPMAE